MTHPPLRPYVWMLVGSFAFAGMGIMAHEAGEDFDWQVIAIFRCVIPLVIVGSIALQRGVQLVFLRPPMLWMRSIAGSLSLIGTFSVLPVLPVADVFTITNIFPIWVALLSWPLLGETPSGQVWVSVVSGISGVALIQQPYLLNANFVVLIPLAVSIFTALAMIGLHRLKGLDTLAVVVHFALVGLLFAVAAFFLFERHKPLIVPTGRPLLLLLGVGLSATVGQLFLTLAFTLGEPAKVSVVGLTQIVFALLLDALVLGHMPDATKFVGVPLVIAPTAWLMLRHHVSRREPLPPEPLETPAPE